MIITACAVATSCCTCDVPSQREGRNFDPHNSHIFQPILMKLETKKDIRDMTPHAKFGWWGTTERGSAQGGHFRWLVFFPFFYSCSRL